MIKRCILTATAALALSACADTPVATSSAEDATPALDVYAARDSFYTTQTPADVLDAAPGWEVGTRFITYVDGRITGFRFYKAPGECGSHTARLWNESGQQIASATFTNETASGWQRVTTTAKFIPAGSYMVSVNTNCKQAKTFAWFTNNGEIDRGWGTAYGGAYGQPTGSMPGSNSGSSFFVDVYFRERICEGPLGSCA
ncbi:MAG TPA: DUF4082 domain-containing protein [Longimicrobium sp.]|nr:DUF4082 domain-containing protein [Longimicrobium sp.]